MSKEKFKPIEVHTREMMEAQVSEYVALKVRLVAVTAQIEEQKLAAEKAREKEVNQLTRDIDSKFAGIQNYCELHKGELLAKDQKSFKTVSAIIGFRTTPHAVDKLRAKETFGGIAKRLLGLVFKDDKGKTILECADYVREKEPELDKDKVLADRTKITEEQFTVMGLKITQEEHFYIDPKSEVADRLSVETKA